MRHSRVSYETTICFLFSALFATASQQSTVQPGLAYHTPLGQDKNDFNIFFTSNSSVSWYYNWSPYPSNMPRQHDLEFFPMIHGASNVESDIATIQSLRPRPRHILTFNEPDGTAESGGSNVDPTTAAEIYISSIVPLRAAPYNFLISHPVTTGSGMGLAWLQAFNQSCYRISPQGCPSDFVSAHFYNGFADMASWLGTLHAFYGNKSIYVTEFALPQASVEATASMLDQSLSWFSTLDWIAGYAWFGMFRQHEAGTFVGPNVAMIDNNGGLTEIGSIFLGGPDKGFAIGAKSTASGAGWYGGGAGGGNTDGTGSGGGGGGAGGNMVSLGMRLCTDKRGILLVLVTMLNLWIVL